METAEQAYNEYKAAQRRRIMAANVERDLQEKWVAAAQRELADKFRKAGGVMRKTRVRIAVSNKRTGEMEPDVMNGPYIVTGTGRSPSGTQVGYKLHRVLPTGGFSPIALSHYPSEIIVLPEDQQ